MPSSPAECARRVLAAVPMVMHGIRTEIRHQRRGDLSVPQFRVMIFLNRHEGASLSDIAEHLGLTLPSMSKMVDGLVARSLVARRLNPGDRRRVTLSLTPGGQTAMETAYAATQERLAARLQALSAGERLTVIQAMEALGAIFGADRVIREAAEGQ